MLKSEALLLVFLSHQVPIKYGGCCDWLFDGLSSLSTRAPYGSVDGKDPANQSSSSSREDEYVLQAFTHHILLKSEAQRRTNGPKLCLIAFDLHGPAYKYTWTKKKETKTKKRDLLPVLSHAWWSEQEYWGSTSAVHQWAVSVGTFHPGCQFFHSCHAGYMNVWSVCMNACVSFAFFGSSFYLFIRTGHWTQKRLPRLVFCEMEKEGAIPKCQRSV